MLRRQSINVIINPVCRMLLRSDGRRRQAGRQGIVVPNNFPKLMAMFWDRILHPPFVHTLQAAAFRGSLSNVAGQFES